MVNLTTFPGAIITHWIYMAPLPEATAYAHRQHCQDSSRLLFSILLNRYFLGGKESKGNTRNESISFPMADLVAGFISGEITYSHFSINYSSCGIPYLYIVFA